MLLFHGTAERAAAEALGVALAEEEGMRRGAEEEAAAASAASLATATAILISPTSSDNRFVCSSVTAATALVCAIACSPTKRTALTVLSRACSICAAFARSASSTASPTAREDSTTAWRLVWRLVWRLAWRLSSRAWNCSARPSCERNPSATDFCVEKWSPLFSERNPSIWLARSVSFSSSCSFSAASGVFSARALHFCATCLRKAISCRGDDDPALGLSGILAGGDTNWKAGGQFSVSVCCSAFHLFRSSTLPGRGGACSAACADATVMPPPAPTAELYFAASARSSSDESSRRVSMSSSAYSATTAPIAASIAGRQVASPFSLTTKSWTSLRSALTVGSCTTAPIKAARETHAWSSPNSKTAHESPTTPLRPTRRQA
mmetsp:Transcript_38773/g.128022  ORF Transcript_38773/g.128022 Transcript_38773/m.128022 type:complete len:379 (-) Transcript_38773:155-1291(-)